MSMFGPFHTTPAVVSLISPGGLSCLLPHPPLSRVFPFILIFTQQPESVCRMWIKSGHSSVSSNGFAISQSRSWSSYRGFQGPLWAAKHAKPQLYLSLFVALIYCPILVRQTLPRLPQNLCICCSLWLQCSSLWYLQNQFLWCLESAQESPCSCGLSWPLHVKLYMRSCTTSSATMLSPLPPLFFALFCTYPDLIHWIHDNDSVIVSIYCQKLLGFNPALLFHWLWG